MNEQTVATHRNRQTLSLRFGTDLVQSSMLLDDPSALLLEYTRAMMGFLLLNAAPARVLMVGLGGGSLPKYCHRHLPGTHITVVEINQEVIALRDEFLMPPDDDRLSVLCADGAAYLRHSSDMFDAILVDGFNHDGQAPELCSAIFYRHCVARLSPGGVLVANMRALQPQLSTMLKRMQQALGNPAIEVPVDDGDNVVALGSAAGNWQACLSAFEARWQALPAIHQATLGAASGRMQRALMKRLNAS